MSDIIARKGRWRLQRWGDPEEGQGCYSIRYDHPERGLVEEYVGVDLEKTKEKFGELSCSH